MNKAALVGLLFFLPFVARGENLLATRSFHGGEVKHRTGEWFLALVSRENGSWTLKPARIRVVREADFMGGAEDETGQRVEADGFDDAMLIRHPRLSPGPVRPAVPDRGTLMRSEPLTLTLGRSRSTLQVSCPAKADQHGSLQCRLLLRTGNAAQVLAKMNGYLAEDGTDAIIDTVPQVYFAGDLDHDGRLDLLLDISDHYNASNPALFLSSAARANDLVAKVAELLAIGC